MTADKITISDLNARGTVKHYTTIQDGTTGKTSTSLTASWSKWIYIEQLNGSRILDNAAITYKEAYKIICRREVTRPTLSTYRFAYDNKEMIIQSVLVDKIGNMWWETITAYTS